MTFSSLIYLAKQGISPAKGNKVMSFASVVVLAACLMITGLAAILSLNVNSFVEYLGNQNEVVVYLKEDITSEQALALTDKLQRISNVKSTVYISKEDALSEQMEYIGEYGDLLASYSGEKNPFPSSYRVKLKDLQYLDETNTAMSTLEGVDYITSPTELATLLVSLNNAVNVTGWGLVILLGAVSLVVIANTIRLTVFARRKEINIMKFVGATNTFIRFPFFVEGLFIGIFAALMAFGVVSLGYIYAIDAAAKSDIISLGWLSAIVPSMVPYSSFWQLMLAGFLAIGTFVGSIGSVISINQYLKV